MEGIEGGGTGVQGTPTNIPEEDPHNVLIIWRYESWGVISAQPKPLPSPSLDQHNHINLLSIPATHNRGLTDPHPRSQPPAPPRPRPPS